MALSISMPTISIFWGSLNVWEGVRIVEWGSFDSYRHVLQQSPLTLLIQLMVRCCLVASISTILAIVVAPSIARISNTSLRVCVLGVFTIPFLVDPSVRVFGWRTILTETSYLRHIAFTELAVLIGSIGCWISLAVFLILYTLPPYYSSVWSALDEYQTSDVYSKFALKLRMTSKGALFSWFFVFALTMGSSIEASVLGGPMEVSLGRLINDLRSANRFSEALAIGFLATCLAIVVCFVPFVIAKLGLGKQTMASFPVFRYPLKGNRISRVSLLLVAAFVLAPILQIGIEAIRFNQTDVGTLINEHAMTAWRNSIYVAFFVSITTASLSFILGFFWWSRIPAALAMGTLIVVAIQPADAYAIGMIELFRLTSTSVSPVVRVFLSHVAYTLPFASALVFTANSRIPRSLLLASREYYSIDVIGFAPMLLRLTWPAVVGAAIVSATLSFCEYIRVTYLAGSLPMMSRFVQGQLSSGARVNVYAIAMFNVALVCSFGLFAYWIRDNGRMKTSHSSVLRSDSPVEN